MEVLWRKLNNLKLYLTPRLSFTVQKRSKKMLLHQRAGRNNNREKLICVSRTLSMKQLWSTNVINVRLAVAPFAGELACEQQTYFRSSLFSLRNYFSEGEKRRPEIRLLFAGCWRAGFSKSRGFSASVSFLPYPIPTRSFFGSRSIFAWPKPKKIPFFGLSLLRNLTEALAKQFHTDDASLPKPMKRQAWQKCK